MLIDRVNCPLCSLVTFHKNPLQVPMIAKTVEGMFHPRSLKMRHEIFKNRGSGGGGGGGGVGGGALGEGSSLLQPMGAATTVLGKSREDVQRIFVDVLREVGREIVTDPVSGPVACCRVWEVKGIAHRAHRRRARFRDRDTRLAVEE